MRFHTKHTINSRSALSSDNFENITKMEANFQKQLKDYLPEESTEPPQTFIYVLNLLDFIQVQWVFYKERFRSKFTIHFNTISG